MAASIADRLALPVGVRPPSSLFEVSQEFDTHLKEGTLDSYRPIPTGFQELDENLGGGLIPESLVLIGGPPGVGKTVFVLQAARNIAARPDPGKTAALVLCFEHSEIYLYHRLLCLESYLASRGSSISPVSMTDVHRVTLEAGEREAGLQTLIEVLPGARAAWKSLVQYWERLYLVKGHPIKTSVAVLDQYLTHLRKQLHDESIVLFVDYLQKVPVTSYGDEVKPERQVRIVTEGLKDLALKHHVAILAVAASDSEGLKGEKVRFEDLWGGSAVQYEPDVAILLNRADKGAICFSIEKNRLGPTGVTVSQQLHGSFFAFSPIVAK